MGKKGPKTLTKISDNKKLKEEFNVTRNNATYKKGNEGCVFYADATLDPAGEFQLHSSLHCQEFGFNIDVDPSVTV